MTVEAETPLNEKIVTLVRTVRGREILVSRPAGTPRPRSEGKRPYRRRSARVPCCSITPAAQRIGPQNVVALRNGEAA